MNTYHNKKGKVLGRAWSAMDCKSVENHKPHPYSSEFMSFGPYMCAGFPPIEIFDTPPRKPLNRMLKEK